MSYLPLVPSWLRRSEPTVVLRVLPHHAVLVASGLIGCVWAPHLSAQAPGGRSYFRMKLDLLDLRPQDLPGMPDFAEVADQVAEVQVSARHLGEVVDTLKSYAALCPRDALPTVYRQAAMLHRLQEELSPSAMRLLTALRS